MNQSNLNKRADESVDEYKRRIFGLKYTLNLTWSEIADIINEQLGEFGTPNKYRKECHRRGEVYAPIVDTTSNKSYNAPSDLSDYTRIRDERNYVKSLYRRMSRENTIKDIAKEAVDEISKSLPLISTSKVIEDDDLEFIGTLLLSDWHYGIEIDNPYNFYDPEEFRARIENLKDRVIYEVQCLGIRELNVLNLGDLISGRIHNTIRINNRIDTITQVMNVSEVLAEFLNEVSGFVKIRYFDCLDNHSRIEPSLPDSLDLENLTRIIRWFLVERLKNNDRVVICDNEFGPDIITFNVFDYKVAAVHGNHDKQNKVIDNLSMITRQSYDLICSAHFHHFSADEKNKCILISNPSLMGTDEFAEKLRLTSIPAQTLIISDKDNVCRYISRIVVD